MAPKVIPAGKLPTEMLARLLGEAASPPAELRLGPAIGEDACAIDVAAGTLVVATDPITFAGPSAGRAAVLVNANDVAATGARPRWFLATVLLPEGVREDDIERLFGEIRRGLEEVGATLAGGHTEVTGAVRRAVVVGQMLGLAEHGIVRTGGLRAGDIVLQVGPVPIEGAAALAGSAAGRPAAVEPEVLRAAARALEDPGIAVVEPALLAAELGASAIHDPTEGGLAAALWEMSVAARVGLRVDRRAVLWFPPGLELCRVLGADPWATLASGALIAAFPPRLAEAAADSLRRSGHSVSPIARAVPGEGVRDRDGPEIPWPERDEVARLLGSA